MPLKTKLRDRADEIQINIAKLQSGGFQSLGAVVRGLRQVVVTSKPADGYKTARNYSSLRCFRLTQKIGANHL